MLFSVGVILTAPFYWWRKGRAQGRGHWAERFGSIPFQEASPGAIWVHAVSLGETLAVAGLVKEMQRAFPERKIYLSHVTPAGREAGEKRLPSHRRPLLYSLGLALGGAASAGSHQTVLAGDCRNRTVAQSLARRAGGGRPRGDGQRAHVKAVAARLSAGAALHAARAGQRGRDLRADGRGRGTIPPARRRAGAREDGWKSEI